jgi:hypothetical protein
VEPPTAEPALALLASDDTFTLGCRYGLAGLALGQGAPRYAQVGQPADARPVAWSPGGRYLLTYLSDRPAVIEALTGAVTWLPEATGHLDDLEWASETVVAYTTWPYDPVRRRFDPAKFELHFLDVAHPEQTPAPMPGVLGYTLSPDGATAAIVQAEPEGRVFSRTGLIALMAPLGGPVSVVAEGQSPAWSPDSRELVYARVEGEQATVHIFEPATGATRAILSTADWGVRNAFLELELTWSPAGGQIALVAREGSLGSAYTVWLVPPEGSQARRLLEQHDPAYPHPVQFSDDGQFLSVTTWNRYWPRLTRVYDVVTGEEVLNLPSAAGGPAWSPDGHALAVSSFEGLALVAEPAEGRVAWVTAEPCHAVLWY